MNEKWQKRFMVLAREISSWSKDPSTKIGAIIVSNDRRILSTGYNGFPSKLADTDERLHNREIKYDYVIHGEMNAIINAAKYGASLEGSWIFVSGLPVCSNCANHIIQSGITNVVMSDVWRITTNVRWKESNEKALSKFKEAKIKIHYIED